MTLQRCPILKLNWEIPVSVQAAIRFITLGCSPTVAIISSSFLRSRFSFSVAFSKILKMLLLLLRVSYHIKFLMPMKIISRYICKAMIQISRVLLDQMYELLARHEGKYVLPCSLIRLCANCKKRKTQQQQQQKVYQRLPLSFFIAQSLNFPLIVTTPLKTSPNAPSPNFSLNSTADLGSSIQLPRFPNTI